MFFVCCEKKRYSHLTFYQAETPCETLYVGTKGRITLASPAHAPIRLDLRTVTGRGKTEAETFHFPLPDQGGTTLFPNSQGFQYEVG